MTPPDTAAADCAFMDEALKEARSAAEAGEVPVGAVAVWEGRIIARARNRVEEALDATCRHRFRMPTDLSQWLVRYEQLATGRFVPVGMRDTLLTKLSDEGTAAIADALLSGRYAMICINDNNAIRHPEQVRTTLEAAFARLLPTPSRYERH